MEKKIVRNKTETETEGEYIAARKIPKCMGEWEYLVKWDNGEKTWEPEWTFGEEAEHNEINPKKPKTNHTSIKQDRITLRENQRRPKDFREVLERHATTRGDKGMEWLARLEKGEANDEKSNDAIHKAVLIFKQYTDQIAEDYGITAERYNIPDIPSKEGYRGESWGEDEEMQTEYRGDKEILQDETGKKVERQCVGLKGQVESGEFKRRMEEEARRLQTGEDTAGLIPITRPDKYVRWDTGEFGNDSKNNTIDVKRCDQIHEVERIQRAKSPLGILCTPVEAGMMGQGEIGKIYEDARWRIERDTTGKNITRANINEAKAKITRARITMQDMKKQKKERDKWKEEGWKTRITKTLRCVIEVEGLKKYAATAEAAAIPVNKHGVPYGASGKEIIEKFLQKVNVNT